MSSASVSNSQLKLEVPEEPKKGTKDISPEAFATVCANCGTTTTPLWRRGPNGDTICNACGLYFKARNQYRPTNIRRNNHKKPENDCEGSAVSNGSCPGDGHCNGTGGSASCAGCPAFNQHQAGKQTLICANCRTTTTPLWRRDESGNTICNACGLYYKLHNMHRPVSMKRSVIKRRRRVVVNEHASEEEQEEAALQQSEKDTSDTPVAQPSSTSIPVANDASRTAIVRKRRVKDSSETNEKRQKNVRMNSNPQQQPSSSSSPEDKTVLPVPPIEDYIVPKRAKLPHEERSSIESTTTTTTTATATPTTAANTIATTTTLLPNADNMDSPTPESPLRSSSYLPAPRLPPISSERHSASSDGPLPPVSLPPLLHHSHPYTPHPHPHSHPHHHPHHTSLPSSTTVHAPPHSHLAEFDAALSRLEHLRRQVAPSSPQAYALSKLASNLMDIVRKAESAVI